MRPVQIVEDLVVADLVPAFQGRFIAVYLTGSHANGTAVAGSVVDLVVMVSDLACSPDVENLFRQKQPNSPVILDVSVVNEALLHDHYYQHIVAELKWNYDGTQRCTVCVGPISFSSF